jgi:hypothetical protein
MKLICMCVCACEEIEEQKTVLYLILKLVKADRAVSWLR